MLNVDFLSVDTNSYTLKLSKPREVQYTVIVRLASISNLPPLSELDAVLYHYKKHWPLYWPTLTLLFFSPPVNPPAGASLTVARRNSSEMMLELMPVDYLA